MKIYQAGFLQAAFKAVEEGSLDQNTTHALHKALLKLSESEDVAALIGESGSVPILKQLETNVDNQPFVETTTVSRIFFISYNNGKIEIDSKSS